MAEMLKGKNGVQAIDVNQGMKYLFENSGFAEVYEVQPIVSNFSLNESVTEDEEDLEMILSELVSEAETSEPGEEEKKKKKKAKSSKRKDDEDEEDDEDEKKEMSSDDAAEAVSEEENTMTTQELMKALSDIEDLVSGPQDLEDE